MFPHNKSYRFGAAYFKPCTVSLNACLFVVFYVVLIFVHSCSLDGIIIYCRFFEKSLFTAVNSQNGQQTTMVSPELLNMRLII
jgi:hypothetical protein